MMREDIEIKILIVEDESIVAIEIESYIKKLGYSVVDICSNATDAIDSMRKHGADIILMDIYLKGDMDGIETAREIDSLYPKAKIIFLTANIDEETIDRAICIDPVAYLSKPYNRQELIAAIKIAKNRILNEDKSSISSSHLLLDHEFSYDIDRASLYCSNEMIILSQKEGALLNLLIRNKNKVVDYYTIENVIWPNKTTNTNTIRTLVKRVRQKLKYQFIKTITSRGYMINIP